MKRRKETAKNEEANMVICWLEKEKLGRLGERRVKKIDGIKFASCHKCKTFPKES